MNAARSLVSLVPLLPLALLAWTAPELTAEAQVRVPHVRLHPIALSGDLAPGVGTPFVDFDTPFGYPDTTAPELDGRGNAGIFATVVDPLDSTQTASGVWKEVGGDLRLLALSGDPTPDGSESFVAFPHPLFEVPPRMANGMAAFAASTTSTSHGLWTDRQGVLERFVAQGDPLPGGPAGETFNSPSGWIFPDGSLLVESRWSTSSGDEGFWRDRTGRLELLVRAGWPAPGMPGAVFAEADSLHLNGPFDHWDTDSAGRLAFNGTVGGPGVDITDDEGIWIEASPDAFELVVAEGDPAPQVHPGFRFGGGSGVRAFGGSEHTALRVNNRGTLLFGAKVHGNGFDYVRTLWRKRAGSGFELIAAAQEPWSGFPGTQQPGTGSPFLSLLSHASINGQDRVAFQDVIPHPLNGPYNLETGIFWDQPGELSLLVTTETWVAGLAPDELINSMRLGELLDDGSLFAVAQVKGGTQSGDRALLLFEPDGSSSVPIREGMLVDLAGDRSDLRVVTELGLGGFDQQRRFGLRLVFADGSSGVFRLEVLRPAAPAASQP